MNNSQTLKHRATWALAALALIGAMLSIPRSRPKDAQGFVIRGDSYNKKGDIENAINDYTEAIRLSPGEYILYFKRAYNYDLQKDFDKAITDYTEAIRLEPREAGLYFNRGSEYGQKNELEKAIADFNEAIQLNTNLSSAYNGRGYANYKKGNFEKAQPDFLHAISLEPTNGVAYGNLAWLLATCPTDSFRNGEEAVTLATKACQLTNWKSWLRIDILAAAYAEVGDFGVAIQYQQKAMGFLGVREKDWQKMHERLEMYRQKRAYHRAAE
ncbi:tetratricopeptide repeat protein [Pedosphaera parvula]|uniref:TPR repeat-containing protein n=1 Tax=Pedosphaera parvula (strain Ellin514) TaxID=320771 RepID=B9XGR6_PEDPL|nr:tetratricopeptide repeat protein [Pedosphaera parvula]EEF60837.1 TPR repeat-containing protein [Pedosphaera parvula Ellin514]